MALLYHKSLRQAAVLYFFMGCITLFACLLRPVLLPVVTLAETVSEASAEPPTQTASTSQAGITRTDETEQTPFAENEWNYVEDSMDISKGIPENASGRLAKIQENGKLVVATEPYFAPQEFIDPSLSGQAQYVGADIELAKEIARCMNVELELVPMDFTEVLLAAQEGSCDLAISGLAYTPGRASVMELSKGYHFAAEGTGTGLLVREEDLQTITSIEDLTGRDIVAQQGSLQEMLLAENVTSYRQFRRAGSTQEVYRQLREGVSDAAAVDIESTIVYMQNNPDCGFSLADGVAFRLDEQFEGDRIAARKGEIELMYFVNGVIDQVLSDHRYETWFEEYTAYAARLGL